MTRSTAPDKHDEMAREKDNDLTLSLFIFLSLPRADPVVLMSEVTSLLVMLSMVCMYSNPVESVFVMLVQTHVCRINSDYHGSLMTLATILSDTERSQEGLLFMQREVGVAPRDTLVRNNMAAFLVCQGVFWFYIYSVSDCMDY